MFLLTKNYGILSHVLPLYETNDGPHLRFLSHRRRGAHPTIVLLAGNTSASERIILYDDGIIQDTVVVNESGTPEQCLPKPWQTASHTTCNDMHSLSMGDLLVQGSSQHKKQQGLFEIFGSGGSRITGMLGNNDDVVIYKTTRYEKPLDEDRYERGRKEVAAMTMLPGSAPDIHGFCGYSSLTEYGDGGDLNHVVRQRAPLSPRQKLEYAVTISNAVAHVHSIDEQPTLIHRDLDPANVVMFRGKLKLIDFHASLFIHYEHTNDNSTFSSRPCNLPSHQQPNQNIDARSVEEIKRLQLDEKMDVYGLGALLFFVLTNGNRPYHCEKPRGVCNDGFKENTLSQEKIRQLKLNGIPPTFPNDLEMDEASMAIQNAILRTMQKNAKDRPSAAEIATELERIQKTSLKKKGKKKKKNG